VAGRKAIQTMSFIEEKVAKKLKYRIKKGLDLPSPFLMYESEFIETWQ